jgi:tetratricopeptide (TPR) repeat protein
LPERPFRLFVSSPSDVKPERDRVQIVADRLNGEFEGIAHIDVLRWEDAFYTAAHSFQEAIDRAVGGMAAADMVVCILWKRAGLKLDPAIWRRQDGSAYESGTVLEFETALAASREHNGVPDVYLFRKSAPVQYSAERHQEEAAQHQLLEAVWRRWTQTPDGYNTAGHQGFADPDDFEQKLELCLRQWLERREIILRGPVWDRRLKGSPFRGLEPFEATHAPVFFGRAAAITKAIEKLRQGVPFLLLIGASGAGKSSLLRAGLLPRIVRHGVIPDVDQWRTALVLPTGDPLQNLGAALFADAALGEELRAGDFDSPQRLVGALRAGGEIALAPLAKALERAAQARAEQLNYETPRPVRLLIALDQAERLFVEAQPHEVDAFAALLQALVAAKLATVVAALRIDAYGPFQRVRAFLALKELGATLDLLPPAPYELEDVVARPVAACVPPLVFESNGESLAHVLVRDAQGGDALPLLQMTLALLYDAQEKRGDGVLRRADYPGMDAAVARAANEAMAHIDRTAPAARAALPALITALVRNFERDAQGRITLTVLPLARAAFEHGRPERSALIDAFIAQRLFTTEEAQGAVRVRVVHEALLRVWPQAVQILAEHAGLIRVRHTLEPMAAEWSRAAAQAKADHLVTSPALLAGAAQLAQRMGEDLSPEMRGFITDSLAADARRRDAARRRQHWVLSATAAGLGVALVLAGFAGWQWREAERATAFARAQELLAREQKEIADVQRAAAVAAEKLATEQKQIAEAQRAAAVAAEQLATEQKKIAEAQRARAERTLTAATSIANSLVFDLALELRNRSGIPIDVVRLILDRAQAFQRQLAEAGEASPALRRSEAAALMVLVDTLLVVGDPAAALKAAERSLEIMEVLTASDPNNIGWQVDLSLTYEKIGNALAALGRHQEALQYYRKDLAIMERLAAAAPDNLQRQRGLAVAYNFVGNALLESGKRDEALEAYQKYSNIMEKLAASDPRNTQWQRDLSISYNKIGNVLMAVERREEALASYRKALVIAEKLAATDPSNAQWQRDLSVSFFTIANVLVAMGQREEALAYYRKDVAIMEKLAAADPGNAEWQRDMSVSLNRIGDLVLAAGQREEALASYRKSLAIVEKLVASNQGNTEWQRDLSISLNKIGDVLLAAGRREEALASYRRGLAMREKLVAADPDNVQWLIDVVVSLYKLAYAGEDARARYARALEILRRLDADGKLTAEQKDWIDTIEKEVAALRN